MRVRDAGEIALRQRMKSDVAPYPLREPGLHDLEVPPQDDARKDPLTRAGAGEPTSIGETPGVS